MQPEKAGGARVGDEDTRNRGQTDDQASPDVVPLPCFAGGGITYKGINKEADEDDD
jgi:hypothetical protein